MTDDTPPDPLAAIVHAAFDDVGWFDADCADWQSDREYVKYADDVAARLRAAGVTLDARPSGDEALRSAVLAYIEARKEPVYSWVIESQAARAEGRPNREVERMERVAASFRQMAALAAPVSPSPDVEEPG